MKFHWVVLLLGIMMLLLVSEDADVYDLSRENAELKSEILYLRRQNEIQEMLKREARMLCDSRKDTLLAPTPDLPLVNCQYCTNTG